MSPPPTPGQGGAGPRSAGTTLGPLLLVISLLSRPAAAEAPRLEAGLVQGDVVADVPAALLLPADLDRKLDRGYSLTLAFQLRVRTRSGRTLATTSRRFVVRFDLWENHYELVVDGRPVDGGLAPREEVRARLARLRETRLAPAALLAPGQEYRVEGHLLLDPQYRARAQRFLTGPTAHRSPGGSRSFFGSVAQFFLGSSRPPEEPEWVLLGRLARPSPEAP